MIDERTGPFGLFILRLAMGILFIAHAALKIFVVTPAGTVKFFAMLGLPPGVAYFIMALEVVGGFALVLGVYARWFAVPLLGDLVGGIVLVTFQHGFFFNAKGGGWEFPAIWAVGLITLILAGDGAWALAPSGLGAKKHH